MRKLLEAAETKGKKWRLELWMYTYGEDKRHCGYDVRTLKNGNEVSASVGHSDFESALRKFNETRIFSAVIDGIDYRDVEIKEES